MPLISRNLPGWPHSAHNVAFKQDGTFYVDLHNFDPDGPGDYAWTVYVKHDAVCELRSRVERLIGRALWSREEFLEALVERFTSSRELAEWIEAEGVTSVRRNDPWAAQDADDGP